MRRSDDGYPTTRPPGAAATTRTQDAIRRRVPRLLVNVLLDPLHARSSYVANITRAGARVMRATWRIPSRVHPAPAPTARVQAWFHVPTSRHGSAVTWRGDA